MTRSKRPAAVGPLVVSTVNRRYFTTAAEAGQADQRAIYLTGSHVWNNLQDGVGKGKSCPDTPEQNDFGAYLSFLVAHGHNFIRLWRWEHFKSQAGPGGSFHMCMSPQPWPRTGPGQASDKKPRFDLSVFDPIYFDRLRERVIRAGQQGIYVSVMFFDGFGLHLCPPPDNVEGHPFHAGNNVNGIGIRSLVDYQVLPLDPRVQAIQEAYIHKVIDTVQDLPNVLYEVANESSGDATKPEVGDSTQWQYWVIQTIREYTRARDYAQHPVGMTMQFPVTERSQVNLPLLDGPADWISPGFDEGDSGDQPPSPDFRSRWLTDPPASNGTKVVITDTDHYAPGQGDPLWAWKAFLRGQHPILLDSGIINVVEPLEPSAGVPAYEALEPARHAMGDTLRYAQTINLIAMEPRGELSSTGYALAHLGHEYLVLQSGHDPFTVALAVGAYRVEWYDVIARRTIQAGALTVTGSKPVRFVPPFEPTGPAVLYLRR